MYAGLIELPSKKTGIVIPSTLNVYEDGFYNLGDIRPKTVTLAPKNVINPLIDNVKQFFAGFGGYTLTLQFGGWLDNDKIIEEKSLYVWAYCAPTKDDINTLILMAQSMKAVLHQDSILIVIEDTPYLV